MDSEVFDIRCIDRERAIEIADIVTWDVYNKLVDEVSGMDSDQAWDAFNESFGAEMVTACLSLVKPPLRTPAQWMDLNHPGEFIMDPDGWRGEKGRSMDDPIEEAEFEQRYMCCTIGRVNKKD